MPHWCRSSAPDLMPVPLVPSLVPAIYSLHNSRRVDPAVLRLVTGITPGPEQQGLRRTCIGLL